MLRLQHSALIVAGWLLFVGATHVSGFVPSLADRVGTTVSSASLSSSLQALTERQMQFWEDVEDGLKDIEEFYQKKDQDIDRIWRFCQR